MNLLVRADADSHIGIGHVMRCLALARCCQERGGHAEFLGDWQSDALVDRIVQAGIPVNRLATRYPDPGDLAATFTHLARLAMNGGSTWLVLDGYHLAPEYQQAIRRANVPLLVIDDMAHHPVYHASALLNQNAKAASLPYRTDPGTARLFGRRYLLLRQEFLLRWERREVPERARNLLISTGGGDAGPVLLQIAEAVKQLHATEIQTRWVVGPANPHLERLRELTTGLAVELIPASNDMPDLMRWADLIVSAAGSTCWEAAFLGVPMLLILLAENQRVVAEPLVEAGAAQLLGWHENLTVARIVSGVSGLLDDPATRQRMAEAGQRLVDGIGADRVLDRLEELDEDRPSRG